jgi:Avidin family
MKKGRGIYGVWWNELNSKMTIRRVPTDKRAISGKYQTAVGDATSRTYPLTGRCDDTGAGAKNKTIGWIVAFDPPDPAPSGQPPNAPSLTAWSGQWHKVKDDDTGEIVEFITTTWILTRQSDPQDDWDSTMVNKDYFFRTKPTSSQLAKAKAYGRAASFMR